MLEPDYFDGEDVAIIALYQMLEDFAMRDIARRLLKAGKMTATADRLIWKMEQAGLSHAAIQSKIADLTGLADNELRAILQDAVLTSWEDDAATLKEIGITAQNPLESESVKTVMNAEFQKTSGELQNLTRTTMSQCQIDLVDLLDEADAKVSSGLQSYDEAVRDVLDDYAGKGITVNYPTGTTRTVEAAVRCAVTTGVNQTSAQVTNQYIVDGGCEYVLVSAHLGARVAQKGQPPLADHASWQGKAYKITGSEPGFPNLADTTGYDIDSRTGEGRVVDPLGLHGYNCRHSHKPWHKDLRNPYQNPDGTQKIDEAENRRRYELSQKQRAIERQIRKIKRKILMKEEEVKAAPEADREKLEQELSELKAKGGALNKKYNDFCKENNLKPQYSRTYISGG